MAPVLIKDILRFSSEDMLNGRVENLLRSQVDPSAGRWTCSKEDTNQRLEAEFQLESPSFINHIDIGNYGSAFVEVFVGNSMWQPGKEFLSLLPSAMLMMPGDCKQWRQTASVRMFHQESFNKRALKEKWDCVRVICRQPFRRDKQFGLSFIRFGTKDEEVSPSQTPTSNYQNSIWSDSSPSTSKGGKLFSPRRKSSMRNKGESPELPSGISRGSKMLQAALDTKSRRTMKPITWSTGDSSLYVENGYSDSSASNTRWTVHKRTNSDDIEIFKTKKRRGLESELDYNSWNENEYIEDEVKCFLDGIDFTKIDVNTVTYSDLRCEMEEKRGRKLNKNEKRTFLKLTRDAVARAIDDLCETEASQGAESDRRCTKEYQEEKSQEIKVPGTSQVSRFNIDDNFFTDASPSQITDVQKTKEHLPPSLATSSDSQNNNYSNADLRKEQLTECPVCGELFSSFIVEEHAATCMNFTNCHSVESRIDVNVCNPLVECPICFKGFAPESIIEHANYCAETAGTNQNPGEVIPL